MIQVVAKAVLILVELLGFVCISVIIGFWWTAEFTQGSRLSPEASMIKATAALLVGAVMYYKLVLQPRSYRSSSRFYFYTYLGGGALLLYFYGIFHWWL